jgi:Spy/CpxP family protein refolding chaperone
MNIRNKLGLAALALAISCGPMVAQDAPQGPPPGANRGQVQRGGPGGPKGPGEMHSRPAHARGERWERRRNFSLARLLSDPQIQQKVGVTADQVAKIRQEESTFRKTEIRQRADVAVQRIDLRDLLAAQTPDRSAIDAKLQQVSAAQLAMEKSRIDFQLNMKQALTPDQREKLRQALRERWQARRGGRGEGPGRPGARLDEGPGPDEPVGQLEASPALRFDGGEE